MSIRVNSINESNLCYRKTQFTIILPLIVFLLFTQHLTSAQSRVHDFDSLYENSPRFQEEVKSWQEHYNLFDETAPVDLILKSDFRNLIRKKHKDEYQDAILELVYNDTIQIIRKIKIKARGNFRRNTCYYPPIMLNFPKKKVVIQHLMEFDKLKLVQLCKKGSDFEQYLLTEYYAYRIYQLITPFSFRVRLLNIHYIDTSGKIKPMTNFAFIIENENQMAARLNSLSIKTENIHSEQTNRQLVTILYMFQFMIGNTDFSIPARHNIKLIKPIDEDVFKPIAIPYDFDYSGIVNAYYALPPSEYPIKTVRERYYMGFCREDQEMKCVFTLFKNKKATMYNMIESSPWLDKKRQTSITRYLNEFYSLLDEEENALKYFKTRCRIP
jgi:hypothetical protein